MAFITQYKIQKDVAGYNGFGLQFSNTKFSATLGANSEKTITVPLVGSMGAALDKVNKYLAIVSVYCATVEGEVWCALNATAAVPAGSSFAANTSDMIVQNKDYAREVKAGDVLHFISPQAATDVSVIFYALPAN
jgi:hydrogenase maturation factor HypF (carbamoyltransferase family)